MSMGRGSKEKQAGLWIESEALRQSPGHPFYKELNRILRKHGFDEFVEKKCARFYAEKKGRPSLAPGAYFRFLMIGYFEGIDSERGIAWRVADSLSLGQFLGFDLSESTPEHSTISRTRTRIDCETHQEVFRWVLAVLAKSKLLKGKTLGVDATTLEANAALRSIVRRDTGETYDEFLTRLAKESGIETPTKEDLIKLDKKRKKKGSNDDWTHPLDPEAGITKMKDGRTHLSHKAEHAVDLETKAVVAIGLFGVEGDTTTLPQTLGDTLENLQTVVDDAEAAEALSPSPVAEVVADKGYHSNEILVMLSEGEMRSYVAEPNRGRRRWGPEKSDAQKATYENRRRIQGHRGKRLQRIRSELVERPNAHLYETGGMRRLHLRGKENILKRLLIHTAGFNLGLVMYELIGRGTPRGLHDLLETLLLLVKRAWATLAAPCDDLPELALGGFARLAQPRWPRSLDDWALSSTGC